MRALGAALSSVGIEDCGSDKALPAAGTASTLADPTSSPRECAQASHSAACSARSSSCVSELFVQRPMS